MSRKRDGARTERQRRLSESAPHGDALEFVYQVQVLGVLDLGHEWTGWRLRGRWLVSPAGDRINPQRLAGMLFAEANRERLVKLKRAAAKGQPGQPGQPGQAMPVPLRRVVGV